MKSLASVRAAAEAAKGSTRGKTPPSPPRLRANASPEEKSMELKRKKQEEWAASTRCEPPRTPPPPENLPNPPEKQKETKNKTAQRGVIRYTIVRTVRRRRNQQLFDLRAFPVARDPVTRWSPEGRCRGPMGKSTTSWVVVAAHESRSAGGSSELRLHPLQLGHRFRRLLLLLTVYAPTSLTLASLDAPAAQTVPSVETKYPVIHKLTHD